MKGKELYDYYLSLGYDHKVATSLAQFTYGDYRFSEFSMDDLYEALCKGREYLPPEELERRRQLEIQRIADFASEVVTTQQTEMERGMPYCPNVLQEEYYRHYYSAKCDMEIMECCTAPAASYRSSRIASAGFETDEYEPIEEKDARTSAAEPMSTFRMTTNTASAGIIDSGFEFRPSACSGDSPSV